jgi:hypothetical protein
MYFRFKSIENNKVILEREKPRIVLYLGMGTSIFLILLGTLLTISSSPEENYYLQGNAMLFLGILAFYTISNYSRKRKSLHPEEICFDNNHGYLEITQDKATEIKSYITYEEIDSFETRRELEKSSDVREYVSIISFRKKDGGIWDLIKIRKEDEAIKLVQRLNESINLSKKSSNLPLSLSNKLEKVIADKYSELRWRNPVKKYLIPFTISVFLVLACLISFLGLSVAEEAPIMAVILLSIMLCLVLTGIGIQIKNFLKDSSITYGLRINNEAIQYFEEHYSGKILNNKIIRLKDLIGIVFSYQPESTTNMIQIKTKEDLEKESVNNEHLKPSNIFYKVFSIQKDKFFLNTTELNTVEKLQMENWIQQNIKKYSGENNSDL